MGRVPDQQRQASGRLYEAFNRRDTEAILALLADDVCWADGLEDGHVEGRTAVCEYRARRFSVIDPRVEPIQGTDPGRVLVCVHQTVRSLDSEVLADHLCTFSGGWATRFDIGEQRA